MCRFFSLISSGDGKVMFFSPEQRVAGVRDKNGNNYNYDSHTSIALHYLGEGKRNSHQRPEDACNKWEYDVFRNRLDLDEQNTENDRSAVLAAILSIDFAPIAGDVAGLRKAVEELKTTPWLDGHGTLPGNIKIFETLEEAADAVRAQDGTIDKIRESMWTAMRRVAYNHTRMAALNEATGWIGETAFTAIYNRATTHSYVISAAADAMSDDAVAFLVMKYICGDIPIPSQAIDYFSWRWSVWTAGYGVYNEVDGTLYCFKKIQ